VVLAFSELFFKDLTVVGLMENIGDYHDQFESLRCGSDRRQGGVTALAIIVSNFLNIALFLVLAVYFTWIVQRSISRLWQGRQ